MTAFLELNALFLMTGVAAMFGARGFESVRDLVGWLGLAHLIGVATVGVVATLILVAGASLTMLAILGIAFGATAVAVAVGIVRGVPRPRQVGARGLPRSAGDVVALILAGVCLCVLVLMFRAFRSEPLVAFDAWNFWIPKAKAIYFFGGLDEQLFRRLPAPSYPLFIPALDAMVFRFHRAADPTMLMAQYWLLLVAFVAAVARLLDGIARRTVVWLFLACVIVLPEVEHRWFQLLGDWTLELFFAIAALMFVRWLLVRERWLIALLPLPVAAMLATKREGQIWALGLAVGICLTTWRESRRLAAALVGMLAATYIVTQLPWRIWWTSRDLTSDLAEGGTGHVGSFGRIFGSAHVVLSALFAYDLWLLAVPIGLAAAALAWTNRATRPAALFYIAAGAVAFAGMTWIVWSDPTIPLHAKDVPQRIPRASASIALLSLVLAPIGVTTALAAPARSWEALDPRAAIRMSRARVATIRPAWALAIGVSLAWMFVVGLADRVRHTAWIFYQGGDQLWYYTGAWRLVHRELVQPLVGYLWTAFDVPIAAAAGPNLANAYPWIILFDVVVLLPVALLALYGTARLIAGRAFACGVLAVWLVLPLAGIAFTNPGYHQRFTELILPQAYGLTAMADFPTMVAAIVSAYFCARVVLGVRGDLVDAAAAGVAAGAAIGIKPSTALFLAGPLLVFACTRAWRAGGVFVASLLPAVITLAVWKYRGYGYLPLVHSAYGGVRVAAGNTLVAFEVPRYFRFNWGHFTQQLDLLREHFWSGRLIEWLVIAGLIGLGRRSARGLALIGAWFAAFVLVKGGYSNASIEDSSLLRILIPTFPAFAILVASLVFLVPGSTRRAAPPDDTRPRIPTRTRLALVGVALALTVVAPLAAIAASSPLPAQPVRALQIQTPLIPSSIDVGLRAVRTTGGVRLSWRGQNALGGPVFYHVYRSRGDAVECSRESPAARCRLARADDLGTTRNPVFVDRTPRRGAVEYRIGVAANWLNDPAFGDVYVLSAPVALSR